MNAGTNESTTAVKAVWGGSSKLVENVPVTYHFDSGFYSLELSQLELMQMPEELSFVNDVTTTFQHTFNMEKDGDVLVGYYEAKVEGDTMVLMVFND